MRSHITQFTIRMVVAFGIAFVGASAFGIVVADSAFERAQVIAQETLSKPFRFRRPSSGSMNISNSGKSF